jgi:hypothetical protein
MRPHYFFSSFGADVPQQSRSFIRCTGACHLSRAGALAIWIRVRENITAPDLVSDEELFRRGARTLFQDLDRYFERLPLLVQRRYLQFDPCDRGD